MVDVTPIGTTARHLLPQQLGALALGGHTLVKLRHFGLLVLLKHATEVGSFHAARSISPIASSDVSYKLD
jgi:hypothetical protein